MILSKLREKFSCLSFFLFILGVKSYRWQKVNGIPYEAIDHSADAVLIAQYTANFFVNEARKNNHKFATPQAEDAALIYNYVPSKTTGSFVQTYFFHF